MLLCEFVWLLPAEAGLSSVLLLGLGGEKEEDDEDEDDEAGLSPVGFLRLLFIPAVKQQETLSCCTTMAQIIWDFFS